MKLSENTTQRYIFNIELTLLMFLVDYNVYAFKEKLQKLTVII